MAYREVTMVEVREVLRQWLTGEPKKRIARRLGMAAKTVRGYVALGERAGMRLEDGVSALTDERLAVVLGELTRMPGRPHGEAWALCEQERATIAEYVERGVRLSKVRKLLLRRGVTIPYATLHRFAVEELGFGRKRVTMPVEDGEPGVEIQIDVGWLTTIVPDERGRRRRLRAWIFTPSLSRYRFVYPVFAETTATAIEACEAAWRFYGGVFRVLIPDNTTTIVHTADPIHPRIVDGFLEYAQDRGFIIDTARVRRPTDKARVERSVRVVRDDCYGGEIITTLDGARARALAWCADEYGLRRHSRTLRKPREHFETVEKSALLPQPTSVYDVPSWSDPKVARDHFAQVQRALYSLPTKYIGKVLRARADSRTVRFYDGGVLVKTHARIPPGQRSTDPTDFPDHRGHAARRDIAWVAKQAREFGVHIGKFADALLDVELPWTRMRRVYALIALAKKHGTERVDHACAIAIELGMDDVRRLERMLELGVPKELPPREARVLPLSRYMRPTTEWALPLSKQQGGSSS